MKAKIFLGDRRGCTKSKTHHSFHTFNFQSYQQADRDAFHRLVTFNDDTLAPLSTLHYSVPAKHYVFIVPVIGGIEYSITSDESFFIEAGQCAGILVNAAIVLNISNPYQAEGVNFICGWITIPTVEALALGNYSFDIDEHKNQLLTGFETHSAHGRIGKFAGRAEDALVFYAPVNVFAFVIEGVFEVEDRLLHARDGLALPNVSKVEFESLSDGAILLVIDFPDL